MRASIYWGVLFFLLVSLGCREQSKEEILQQGIEFSRGGNPQAAITLFKQALDKDPNFIDARIALGNAYFDLNKLDFSEKELDKAKRQDPKNQQISLRLAQIYQKTGRVDLSLHELAGLESQNPNDSVILCALGEGYALKGDFKTSEQKYRQALTGKPSDVEANLGLARVLFATKRMDQGNQLLQSIIANEPQRTEPLYLKLQISFQNSDRQGAIDVLKRIRQIKPDDMSATYLLGLLLLDAGQIEAARALAAEIDARQQGHPAAMRINSLSSYMEGNYSQALPGLQKSTTSMSDSLGYYATGLTYYQMGQFEQAVSSFQRAIDISPGHAQSRLMLAQTFLKQGRIEECIRSMDAVLHNNPGNAVAYSILGSAYLAQGKYDQGMAYLNKALDMDPNLIQAQVKKGLFNLASGNLNLGEADLLNAVATSPDLLNSRILLATYYLKTRNFPKAVKLLQEGLETSADQAILYNYLAAAYFGQKKNPEAVACLQKAKSIKPDYLAPYINLANYHIGRQDYPAAVAEYQAALKSAPDQPDLLSRLAAVYELSGDSVQAENHFQRAANSGDPAACLAYAEFLLRHGQTEKNIETLRSGFAKHPDNVSLATALGGRLQSIGQFEEASRVYSQVARVAPKSGVTLQVGLYLQQGNYEAASELARQVIGKQPAEEYGYLLESAIHQQRKQWLQAENSIRQGLANSRNDVALRMRLAGIFSAQGNYRQAMQTYDEILSENPRFVPAIFAKGLCYQTQGNKTKAFDFYKAALAQDESYAPALNNMADLMMDLHGNYKDALPLASKAFLLMPEDASVLDTLGYALLKNNKPKLAIVFLEKASQLRPGDAVIKAHLSEANKSAAKSSADKNVATKKI